MTRARVAATVVSAAIVCIVPARDAAAQSYRDVAPIAPPAEERPRASPSRPEPRDDSQDVAIRDLRGIAFVRADAAEPTTQSAANNAITATGAPLLTREFLDGFSADLHKPLTFARLAGIRRAVVQRYRAAGQPLVDVYVPEQDVSDGVVKIVIAEFRAGRVIPQGNRYFSDALLMREMPLASGEPIRESDIASGLALLNANPYRRVDVIYAPGAAHDTTDVVLQTEDRFPFRIYGGYNNDGVRDLGRDRILAGFDYGNLFGIDARIGYQMTASNDLLSGNPDIEGRPDRPRYIAHAFNVVAPLPWLDRVELFGVFAESTPRLPDSYGQTGLSSQISFRYDWRLPPLDNAGAWQQQVQLGYDFKRSNNDLEFGGFQVFNANTHIHQFVVAYDLSKSDASGDTHLNASLFASPGYFDSNSNDEAYDAARLGAKPRYQYMQLSAQRDMPLGTSGFSVSARGLFQWTGSTLLPSEELGLGGDATVRGYEPYAAQGDRGWNLQTELRAPAISAGIAAMQPFVFFDAGHVWNRIAEFGEVNDASLASVGAGIRVQVGRFVSFRGTYGFPLKAVVPNGSKAPVGEIFLVIGS
ncbi:ShlB/FhaC/HecB family hemolysin secretion/activation protein [Caballeronia novacaledonica]|uniref:ShlB/FhaC/HecB family hemolysin secretion/activation protein n=1 Tax=Caballeronia novacaledonica TaxID=1544861 RepID=UPI001EE1D4CC|nr:ShlB/FhaC/HecB family hemolysin secretion/activation protein [Caballeronia novacaledonica]GJH12936.1 ShlB/FhaC/HecB family hemolysin secretion/activation protein [Caballeronia novacaledonica]